MDSLLLVLAGVVAALLLAVCVRVLMVRRSFRRERTSRAPAAAMPKEAASEPEEEATLERSIFFPEAEPRGALGAGPASAAEPLRFTVYHPPELVPERWAKLLVYAHRAGAEDEVDRDRQRVLDGEPDGHRKRSEDAVVAVRRDSLIRVVPELPGCRFNPPETAFLWLEDWHGVLFRVQAHAEVPGFAPGRAVNGRVAFFVESVLVGEVPIWALIADREQAKEPALRRSAPVAAYERVFASYSHRDGEIVSALGRAYKALGMDLLRDVEVLRSGEEWNPRLLELIEGADVFQLYWSREAGKSPYVAQEWRHALGLGRERFIRPVYWRRPMPDPPAELGSIHFAYLPGFEDG